MGETNEARTARARGEVSPRRLEKQMAIASASCTVFGREGYARASVDALAAEAGVSTRTLYNHFPGGKAQLFQTVVTWTSSEVRDAQLACLRSVLHPERPPRAEDLERDLVALARGFAGLMTDYPSHFALVRHIHAEADHVPPEVLKAWYAAGPEPVGRAVAEAMARLEDAGLLDTHGDAAMTAAHFMALTTHTIVQFTHYGVVPLPRSETDRLITTGVAAFLRAYGRRPAL
ncbi:TetR/AcrR family transcriptional regulator [Streptomyces sp. NPDC048192]|uniref:TetR/AcrR family transcriptional regulator n=1 Tax=unclassified Streptomyces TaxID=2593676 RepID=UPI0037221FE0